MKKRGRDNFRLLLFAKRWIEVVLDPVIFGNWGLSLKRGKFRYYPIRSIIALKGALIKRRLIPEIEIMQDQSGFTKVFNLYSLIEDLPSSLGLPRISNHQGYLILPFLKDPLYKNSKDF